MTTIEILSELRSQYSCFDEQEEPVYRALSEAIKAVSAQPEIIRCKDCRWWSNDLYRECSSPNCDNVHVTPAGFYCGYAERRVDDER